MPTSSDILVADSDDATSEDFTAFGGAPSSVRESHPHSFAGAQCAASGSDTEELDADVEAQMHAAWVAKQADPPAFRGEEKSTESRRKSKRKRVEIISPAMQGAQQAVLPAAPQTGAAAIGAVLSTQPESLPQASREFTERAIGGISIAFPADLKPHAPQIAVMAKVVTALRLKKHALLEAPTGTGKSLALLSAALAWQNAEAKKLHATAGGDLAASRQAEALREKPVALNQSANRDHTAANVNSVSIAAGNVPDVVTWSGDENMNAPPAPPRIFVCSRTHSQLAQLLTELKRTPYEPEMTVLGSRSRYCCNSDVQNSTNSVDAMCAKAVKARTCSYHAKADALAYGLSKLRVWDMEDIEDLRAEDGAGGGCPFFATRQLAEGASLIFAPYNYIFDAGVREALQIDVKGAGIIIDEGHNLEDVCRESASFDITATALATCNREIETMSKRFPQLEHIAVFVRRFSEWFERASVSVSVNHGGERVQTPGVSVAELSAAIGLPPTLPYARLCKLSFEASCNVQEILKEQGAAGWGAASLLAAEKLCWRCMDMLTAKPEDYRVVVRSGDRGSFSGRGGRGGFRNNAAGRRGRGGNQEASFHIWCLNSAVSFVPVAEQARCVIVTSGTLAPMAGMQGELGASFPLKLEAQHVIPSRQLHVEALADLGEVTYKNYSGQRAAAFNDSLGRLLLSRLPVIPNGALCFFSSYSLMERAVERWQETPIWDQLCSLKHVVQEGRGAENFAETIEEYYNAVSTGAFLLAVCRGKVSEGLDFKAEKARAVFVVGIPFPSYQDTKVKLKQQFNDSAQQRLKRPGAAVSPDAVVLPGGTWYRQQGYRAYNQAIGRCIRNLADYGAVLLVDARFHTNSETAHRHREQLSRWLRSRVKQFHPSESPKQLADFFAGLKANPPATSSVANICKAATTGPSQRSKRDKIRHSAPSAPTALELFASNFHPPPAESDPDASTEPLLGRHRDESESTAGNAMEGANAKQEVLEQECTAVIFERGALGLEFVQQADRVIVSTVQPGSVAAKLPFPKIKKGMQLLRVSCDAIDELAGSESTGGEARGWSEVSGQVVVRPPAASWAAKLSRMPRPLTLVMLQPKQKAGMQTTIDSHLRHY